MNHQARILPNSRTRQAGLTLVEMMVAITISLILMAGVTQIFLSSKSSHTVQNGMVQLQENARFALDSLANDIQMAGFAVATAAPNRVTIARTLNNAAANAIAGITIAAGSDTIEVNYQSATDCLGNGTGIGGIATNLYFTDGTNLMCSSNGGAAQVIAEGVEDMQILYGIDTNSDGIANQYVAANAGMTITQIVSVRIALLVNTVNSVGLSAAGTYSLLNETPVGPFNDNLLRQVYTRTIILRNQIT
ncbi:MAG: PilW family protein [Gammaproteobacteria bacterium]|nr:PilW family protein [Gammaproteobacteria bacterium]